MAFDPAFLLPDATALRLESIVSTGAGGLRVGVTAIQPSTSCPICDQPTTRVHSRYTRTLLDLPWADQTVQLQLNVRKFICSTKACSRSIFTERLPSVVAPWARRTLRLADRQRQVGLTTGGRAGERLTKTLAMPVGDDTLLTLMRQTSLLETPTPQVLGVDDWALRKGQSYATILVDLETGKPIDLLSERSADQFAQWLHEHPGVTIISRDRGGIYAEGAREGAPDAVQVADRWHILKNLGEALLRVFEQRHQALDQAFSTLEQPVMPTDDQSSAGAGADAVVPGVVDTPKVVLRRREQEQQARQAAKCERHARVRELHAQGWSLHAIAAHTGLDRRTVRKYVQLPSLPAAQPRGQRSSLLDPFKPYLLERWQAGCRNAMQLLPEIQAQGYKGQRSILRDYLSSLRKAQGLPPRSRNGETSGTLVVARKPPTLRTLTWLIIRRADTLNADEQADVLCARQAHPDVETAITLAQDFAELVRSRRADAFDAWLDRATESGLVSFSNFAKSLRQDEAAVRAALTLPWSNERVAYCTSLLVLGRIRGVVTSAPATKRDGCWRSEQTCTSVIIARPTNPAPLVPMPDRLWCYTKSCRQFLSTQHPCCP